MAQRKDDNRIAENLGLRLKMMRDYLDITISEAGFKFDRSYSSIRGYEMGVRFPPLIYVKKICDACGIPVDSMFMPMKEFSRVLYAG